MQDTISDEYLLISGIQHFAFCPRQWALIHVEMLWQENVLTFLGQEFHSKVNDPYTVEKRNNKIIARAVPVVSHRLKVYGVADLIEFDRGENGIKLKNRNGLWWPLVIEYKVGKAKLDNCDAVQLCAQAMCFEEMFNLVLNEGQIYYGKTRKRKDILFDDSLRFETIDMVEKMHELFHAGITPPATYKSACQNCSLNNHCMPQLSNTKKVEKYLAQMLKENSDC